MMGKSMVSYRLSLTPIHWDTHLSPPRRFYFTDRNLSRDVTLREAASGAWLSGQWLLQCPKLQREGPERLGAVDGMLAWWYSKMPWESPTYEYCWFSIWSILIHFGLSVDFEFKMMMFRIFWDALRPNYPLLLVGRSKHGGSQDMGISRENIWQFIEI